MTSLKTSEVGLIIKEKVCEPFWTEQCQELSDKLWLPIRTDYVDLDLTSSSTLSNHLVERSWFSTNLIVPRKKKWSKTSLVSYTSSVADCMGSESTKPKSKKTKILKEKKCLSCDLVVDTDSNRFFCSLHFEQDVKSEKCRGKKGTGENCGYVSSYKGFCGHHITVPKPEEYIEREYETSRKIRLDLTKEQTAIVKQWIGVSRKCYNSAVSKMRLKTGKPKLSDLRDLVTKELDNLLFCKEVPLKIKQEAVGDFIKATANAIAKYKKTKKVQKIRFRSRKKTSQSIYINVDAIKVLDSRILNIYKTKLGSVKVCEDLPDIFTHCRIVMKHNRFFYLCIPLELEKTENIPFQGKDSIAALDPGERTFQTFYSPVLQGSVGERCRERFYKTFTEADCIRSKMDKLKVKLKKARGKDRKAIKNRVKQLRKKFLSVITKPTRLVKELHSKTALFLCKNFQTILIPEYSSQSMADNLHETVNRSNQALSHYSFRERLKHTAKRMNRQVHIVPESYTTLTCTKCGHLNDRNKAEVLTCRGCSLVLNRDIRGSRNILIKNLIWFKNQPSSPVSALLDSDSYTEPNPVLGFVKNS